VADIDGTITVTVLLFAALGEEAGRRRVQARVPADTAASGLWAYLPLGGDPRRHCVMRWAASGRRATPRSPTATRWP